MDFIGFRNQQLNSCYIPSMHLLSAFLRSVSSSWLGVMGGIGGIVFAALSFYVSSSAQKTAFAIIALLSLFVAFFQAWKKEHLAAVKQEVTFEVDYWRSLVRLNLERETQKHNIEISLRIRFVNEAVHPILIRRVDAQLMQRKRFGKTIPVDEFIKSLQTEITNLLEQNGLSVPPQSLSDYYIFKWSARMPKDFLFDLLGLGLFVRIDMYALKQRPLRIDFWVGDWWQGAGRLVRKTE